MLVKFFKIFFFMLFFVEVAFSDCLKCHKFSSAPFEHKPFLDHDCEICHMKKEAMEPQKSSIKWTKTFECYEGINCVKLKDKLLRDLLYFEVPSLSIFQILDVSNPPYIKIDLVPSKIDVSLCALDRGVFLMAKFCVKTNSPVILEVDCNGMCGGEEEIYRTLNIVEIAFPLKEKEISCSFMIEGIEGNPYEINKSFVFNSLFSFDQRMARNVQILPGVTDEQEKFLCFETDGYVMCKLGIVEGTESPVSKRVKGHPLLVSAFESAINRCYRCHPKSMLGVSHPVGIELSSVMKSNLKLKAVKLIDGKVTCVSCHNPHTSRYPYLLRDKQERLCVSCHGEKYR